MCQRDYHRLLFTTFGHGTRLALVWVLVCFYLLRQQYLNLCAAILSGNKKLSWPRSSCHLQTSPGMGYGLIKQVQLSLRPIRAWRLVISLNR